MTLSTSEVDVTLVRQEISKVPSRSGYKKFQKDNKVK